MEELVLRSVAGCDPAVIGTELHHCIFSGEGSDAFARLRIPDFGPVRINKAARRPAPVATQRQRPAPGRGGSGALSLKSSQMPQVFDPNHLLRRSHVSYQASASEKPIDPHHSPVSPKDDP